MKYQYKIHDKTVLHQGHVSLYRYDVTFEGFRGEEIHAIRECSKKGDVVGVLAFDPEQGKFLLVEQFRIGLAARDLTPWALEIVAGHVETGDAIDDTALRELHEESGCQGRNLQHLLSYYPSLGASAGRVHLYYAEVSIAEIIEYGGLAEETEDIRVHAYDDSTVREMIKDGRINNAMTLLALQHFWLHGKVSHGATEIEHVEVTNV